MEGLVNTFSKPPNEVQGAMFQENLEINVS